MIDRFREIATRLEDQPHLLRLGRLFSETVLIEIEGDEIYLTFDKGRIVEEGDHMALIRRDGGIYRRLFEKQALELTKGLVA